MMYTTDMEDSFTQTATITSAIGLMGREVDMESLWTKVVESMRECGNTVSSWVEHIGLIYRKNDCGNREILVNGIITNII
jgi:hypothetical protein